ncbi:6301_t:CDS:2, partial [Funneliformis mosseae]
MSTMVCSKVMFASSKNSCEKRPTTRRKLSRVRQTLLRGWIGKSLGASSKEFVLRAVGSQKLRVNVLKERPRRDNFLSIRYSTGVILVYRNEHPG